jgi:hypothetical protein
MQRDTPDNANPTILNVSQLPSRAQKRSTARVGSDSKYDGVVLSSPYWSDASSDDSQEAREEVTDDALDEQEIYGKHACGPAVIRAARPGSNRANSRCRRNRASGIFASPISED